MRDLIATVSLDVIHFISGVKSVRVLWRIKNRKQRDLATLLYDVYVLRTDPSFENFQPTLL